MDSSLAAYNGRKLPGRRGQHEEQPIQQQQQQQQQQHSARSLKSHGRGRSVTYSDMNDMDESQGDSQNQRYSFRNRSTRRDGGEEFYEDHREKEETMGEFEDQEDSLDTGRSHRLRSKRSASTLHSDQPAYRETRRSNSHAGRREALSDHELEEGDFQPQKRRRTVTPGMFSEDAHQGEEGHSGDHDDALARYPKRSSRRAVNYNLQSALDINNNNNNNDSGNSRSHHARNQGRTPTKSADNQFSRNYNLRERPNNMDLSVTNMVMEKFGLDAKEMGAKRPPPPTPKVRESISVGGGTGHYADDVRISFLLISWYMY